MTTNDDLDDFFKKKDRKGNKHKKQTGLLTNNEELLKQLVIVTSATSAFKENLNFDDDEDAQLNDDAYVGSGLADEPPKHPHHHRSKTTDENKHYNGQASNITETDSGGQQQQQQQDEWEDFDTTNSKYEQLRLKFTRGNTDDPLRDDDDYDDDENRLHSDDHSERNLDREQQKDKPVWKIDQVKQTIHETSVEEKQDEARPVTPPVKAATTSVYRPPQLRTGGSAVTIVSGVNQRTTKKKEQPNLASTDEFPTLKSTIQKK